MYNFLSTEIPLESLLVDMQHAGWTSCKLQPPGEKYSQPRVLPCSFSHHNERIPKYKFQCNMRKTKNKKNGNPGHNRKKEKKKDLTLPSF